MCVDCHYMAITYNKTNKKQKKKKKKPANERVGWVGDCLPAQILPGLSGQTFAKCRQPTTGPCDQCKTPPP